MTLCAPSLNCAALGSVGAPLSIRMLPLLAHRLDQRLGLQLADGLVVEGHVVVGAVDEPVVGDDLAPASWARSRPCRRGGLAVDRVEHQHLGALVDRRVDLLGLLGLVLVGVVVVDLAVGAQLRDLRPRTAACRSSRSGWSSTRGAAARSSWRPAVTAAGVRAATARREAGRWRRARGRRRRWRRDGIAIATGDPPGWWGDDDAATLGTSVVRSHVCRQELNVTILHWTRPSI